MKRWQVVLAIVAAVVAVVVGVRSYQTRPVIVKDGERVVCVYGHRVSDAVRELRVGADQARRYSVRSKTIVCEKHLEAERLYSEAQDELKRGDTDSARRDLARVAAIDPGYRKTSVQIREIDTGHSPLPDTDPSQAGSRVTPSTDPSKGASSKPTGPVAGLLRFVPDSLSGFGAGAVESDELSVSRRYVPTPAARVTSLVIAAEQFKSAAAARSSVDSEIARYYGSTPGRAAFSGRDAYFGSLGGFAVLAWNEGAVRIVIEMRASGADVASLKPDLTAVAAVIVK